MKASRTTRKVSESRCKVRCMGVLGAAACQRWLSTRRARSMRAARWEAASGSRRSKDRRVERCFKGVEAGMWVLGSATPARTCTSCWVGGIAAGVGGMQVPTVYLSRG